MALADETDPVEAIRLILDDTTDADWLDGSAGSKPDYIERYEETDYSRKQRREVQESIYVWSPEVGTLGKFSADGSTADDQEVIQVEVWSPTGAVRANDLASDVVSLIAAYTNDVNQNTEWTDIWPEEVSDERAQARASGVDHSIITVQVRLRDLRPV